MQGANSWASNEEGADAEAEAEANADNDDASLPHLLLCGLMTLPKLRLSRARTDALSQTHAGPLTHSHTLALSAAPLPSSTPALALPDGAAPCGRA